MISGDRQKVMQKAVRWPCGVCGRDEALVIIQGREEWRIPWIVIDRGSI